MISINPKIMHGVPHVTGTRIPVKTIAYQLMRGYRPHKVVKEFPPLTLKQVYAAREFVETALNNAALWEDYMEVNDGS